MYIYLCGWLCSHVTRKYRNILGGDIWFYLKLFEAHHQNYFSQIHVFMYVKVLFVSHYISWQENPCLGLCLGYFFTHYKFYHLPAKVVLFIHVCIYMYIDTIVGTCLFYTAHARRDDSLSA